MKIIITTPLYPPEIGDIAIYSEQLAKKLSLLHSVSLITYSNHPLHNSGFNLFYAEKNKNILERLLKYFKILIKETDKNDVIILQTGIGAALPAFIVSRLKNKRIIFRFFEDESLERKKIHTNSIKIFFISFLQKIILNYSTLIVCHSEKLKNILLTVYGIKKDNIKIIPEPQDEKVVLPFSRDKIGDVEISKTPYVKRILEKGYEKEKISWEEHVERFVKTIQ